MLLLCSNGLTSDKLMKEVKKYAHSVQTAAVVVTADNEYKEKNYHVNRVIKELSYLGVESECFDIDKQNPELLLRYDIVEFIGGNPYYLLDALRRTNSKSILKKLAKDKILIAWSAGAIVMGKSLDLINVYSPEMNFLCLEDLTGIGLTDMYILPHYSKFLNIYEGFEERCQEFEKRHNCKVVRLNDGEGIIIE